jgi:hypothetical protein
MYYLRGIGAGSRTGACILGDTKRSRAGQDSFDLAGNGNQPELSEPLISNRIRVSSRTGVGSGTRKAGYG